MTSALPALPTSDPLPQAAELAFGRLTYVDEGPRAAPALLAVHGVPGSVRDFRYLAPQLASRVRLIRVDLPGFGGSTPCLDGIATFSGRARVLLALADHLGLARFGVMGHSMGGGTALAAFHDHPGRVSHLVLLSSVGLSLHRGIGLPPWCFRVLRRLLAVPLLGPLLVARSRQQFRRRGFKDEIDRRSLDLLFRVIAGTDFAHLRRAVARRPLPPTLLAHADDDRLVERHVFQELARALPGARELSFPDGGHNIQKTRAVELARAIGALLCEGAP